MIATLTKLLVPVLGAFIIWKMIARNATPRIACRDCHTVARAEKRERGSFALEIVLWFLLFVPGFAYALWRMRDQSYHCPYCDSENLVPADSEEGLQIREHAEEP